MAKKVKVEKTQEELMNEALVPEDEQPYEIPKNWDWVKVKSLCEIVRGVNYKKEDIENEPSLNNCLILRGGNIQSGDIVDASDNVYIPKSLVANKQLLREGDVIIVASTGSKTVIGKAATSNCDYTDKSFGAFLSLIRPININKIFFGHYFQTLMYRNKISELSTGININNIKREFIENLTFPLPPLPEQKRIVDKLESMLGKINESRELIEQAKETFKTRKSSILAKAFSGELTAKWREEHLDDSQKEWKLTRFGEVINTIQAGKSFTCLERPPIGDEIGVLKVSSVSWNIYQEEESKTCQDPTKVNPNYFVNEGDFLISRANTIELVGACVIAKNVTKKIMLSDKILRINFVGAIKEYILFFLQSKSGRKEIESKSTGNQLSMRNISQNNLKDIIFSLPSLEEQKEIVKIVEHLLSHEDQAKELIANMEDELNLLEKSILSKAFRGELGTNNLEETLSLSSVLNSKIEQLELLRV